MIVLVVQLLQGISSDLFDAFRMVARLLERINFVILRKHEFIARNNYSREIQYSRNKIFVTVYIFL